MFKFMAFAILLVFAVFSSCTAAEPAQEAPVTLTLKWCIEKAMAVHPDLKHAQAQIRAASAVVGQAMSAYYPQINFTSTYTRSGGPDRNTSVVTTNQGTPSGGQTSLGSFSVSSLATQQTDSLVLSQYITDFGRTPDQVTATQESYMASLCDLATTRNNIINSVEKAYYNCIAARELLKVRQENVANLDAHLKQSQGFYSVGRVAKNEVTKSEVDLATARVDMINADVAHQVSRVTLINAMGLDTPINFELESNLTLPEIVPSLEEIFKITSENRPEYLRAEVEIRAQKANLAAAIADFYPTLTGNAQYNWRGSDYPLDRYWQLGLQLTLPVTDGNFRLNGVRQNQAQLDGLVAQKERLWQNITLEVNQSYLAMKASREKIVASQKALALADENFKLARGRYNVGVGSNLEFTDAQVALLQARTDYIGALVGYFNSIADLEKAAGVELKKTEIKEFQKPEETKLENDNSNIKNRQEGNTKK